MPTTRTSILALLAALSLGAASPVFAEARNVVLVHGALVDGSGWRAVHDILVADGYDVSIVQMPLTGLEADLSATRRVLDQQDGPVVLVGHSYGGVVITAAGVDPNVAALVYVAAFQPDVGESLGSLGATQPAVMAPDALVASEDGFVTIDPAQFRDTFGADLPQEVTDFMAVSQSPTAAAAFGETVAEAAWHDKSSFGIVATQDGIVNPDLERFMYERSGATVTEIDASHAVYMSQPQAVADVIKAAAQSVE